MLKSDRHKRAVEEGAKAFKEGKPITENPYLYLGRIGRPYASLFDKGYNEEKDRSK